MQQHEIKAYKILEAFHRDPNQTQRDLSKKLKISLGMVNVFTKRLSMKGFFKINEIPKGKVKIRYTLTPRGIAEKARLNFQYINYSMQYYKATRARFDKIFRNISDSYSNTIYFYGLSELAEIAYIAILENELKLEAIIDPKMEGKTFLGHKVYGIQRLKSFEQKDFIAITKFENYEDSIKVLNQNGISMERIVDLQY
jgi:DNA-binding MarR family transcriptional regulator